MGGQVQLLGIPKEPVTIDFSKDIIFKGLSVYGVIGRRMYDTWLQMQTFLSSGIFDPMPAVTHTYPLEDIQKALDVIHSGNAGKVILEIGSK
jgi:threonine 3-dehydrogenase